MSISKPKAKSTHYDVLVIGAGASGVFTAIQTNIKDPSLNIAILEKNDKPLNKVKISGGGRCNVTHGIFTPREFCEFYPRGNKALISPFHQFLSGDTMQWFEENGVALKIEEDGRVFPVSNTSQSVIDCFMNHLDKSKTPIFYRSSVSTIFRKETYWEVSTKEGQKYTAKKIVIATGSNPKVWDLLDVLGYSIVCPVASLFTFRINDKSLTALSGISQYSHIEICNHPNLQEQGNLLITHKGVSGPCVLKLSAWGARVFHKVNYQFDIKINWFAEKALSRQEIIDIKSQLNTKKLDTYCPFGFSKRLWYHILDRASLKRDTQWCQLSKKQLEKLYLQVTEDTYSVTGKNTFKEEFVTAGGVELNQINFKTFSSKKDSDLYVVGEALDIDALTGGFNFQNAWTSAYVAAQDIARD